MILIEILTRMIENEGTKIEILNAADTDHVFLPVERDHVALGICEGWERHGNGDYQNAAHGHTLDDHQPCLPEPQVAVNVRKPSWEEL